MMDFTSMAITDNSAATAAATSPPTQTLQNATTTTSNNGSLSGGSGIFISDDGMTIPDSLYSQHQHHHNHPSIVAPQNMAKLRRDSIAHSQGMGGVSWGSLTIGSWLRDEVMFHATLKNARSNSISKTATVHLHPPAPSHSGTRRPSHFASSATSPPVAYNAYLPNLEKQYCKDYSCCGLSLPGLHDLLRHYEETHIATSPGTSIAAANTASSVANTNAASLQKRKAYQSQGNLPRQQQPSARNPNVNPRQQHIIQQQLHHRHPHPSSSATITQQRIPTSPSTTGTTATNVNVTTSNGNPTITTTSASTTNTPGIQGPQLHLNGNLVDAVSTNDVFLQANANGLNQGAHMITRHDDTNAANQSNHNNGKIPITPQHSFNNYSLNISSSKSGPNNKMNSINFHNNHNNHHNSNNINMNKSSRFSQSISTGMELEFMDEDMIGGSDVDDTPPNFMRLSNASAHQPMTTMRTPSNITATRFPSMNMPSVHHPTPPPSTKAGPVPSHMMNDDDDDEEDDDDDEEDDEDEDDDLTGETSNGSQSKTSHQGTHRQEGYIDDPARRLYVMDHEEHKPFKCPVIGCDKTYKNQNGLKYHKLHGHQNQKLHENSDGTFSIIDPESNEPYPDGMGYEKDKPYRCEVCGKRYKNLNGLKYHRGHSTH